MIVYNDLRPGNYVKYFTTAKQKKLLCLTLSHLLKIQSGALEVWPVDLVNEWFPRFGFSCGDVFNHYYFTKGFIKREESGWFFIKGTEHLNEHPILYIHQFQNLFYTLTGEDLELK
jgi:hypothetical protein